MNTRNTSRKFYNDKKKLAWQVLTARILFFPILTQIFLDIYVASEKSKLFLLFFILKQPHTLSAKPLVMFFWLLSFVQPIFVSDLSLRCCSFVAFEQLRGQQCNYPADGDEHNTLQNFFAKNHLCLILFGYEAAD